MMEAIRISTCTVLVVAMLVLGASAVHEAPAAWCLRGQIELELARLEGIKRREQIEQLERELHELERQIHKAVRELEIRDGVAELRATRHELEALHEQRRWIIRERRR